MAWGSCPTVVGSLRPDPHTPSGTRRLGLTAALLSVMRRTDGLLPSGEKPQAGTTRSHRTTGAVLTITGVSEPKVTEHPYLA